ncbi:hypothetical protein TSH100_17890 [Azospirillum sp. TSH100]|uniref:hypothetical protein n=1 Tax=Azospirillum sp. TSH100 TaxID=652764 RepID=UPI000D608E23|nr:hypothetical protein [Azospirillum sp. TSH100]PWC84425.1 hypothetical protein TSH100_17890 [Azospirillum sp. TSH100]QCG87669.1 hypothetical protein E6C72_07990 [Azospirillum sp. TSH100]
MIRRSILLGCLLAAVTAACTPSPRFETTTNYFSPVSEAGKLCVAQCRQAQSICDSAKELALQTCRAEGLTRAHADYRAYLKSLPKDYNKKKMKTLSDFEREISCSSNLYCSSDYDQCFKACGGRIEQQTFCVKDCKLMKPPQPDGVAVGPKTAL